MTATAILHMLLDERGVKYKSHYLYTSWYADMRLHVAKDNMNGTLNVDNLTPAQAIAATLGRGMCHMEQIPECQYDDIECDECGVALWAFSMDMRGEGIYATPNYCPYCGARLERQE